jgi:hypothetical protein
MTMWRICVDDHMENIDRLIDRYLFSPTAKEDKKFTEFFHPCSVMYVSNNSLYVIQIGRWGVAAEVGAGIGFIRPCFSPSPHLGLLSQVCLV